MQTLMRFPTPGERTFAGNDAWEGESTAAPNTETRLLAQNICHPVRAGHIHHYRRCDKLTRTMQEREHTLVELARMEKVRNYLIDNGISDLDSFNDYLREIH